METSTAKLQYIKQCVLKDMVPHMDTSEYMETMADFGKHHKLPKEFCLLKKTEKALEKSDENLISEINNLVNSNKELFADIVVWYFKDADPEVLDEAVAELREQQIKVGKSKFIIEIGKNVAPQIALRIYIKTFREHKKYSDLVPLIQAVLKALEEKDMLSIRCKIREVSDLCLLQYFEFIMNISENKKLSDAAKCVIDLCEDKQWKCC